MIELALLHVDFFSQALGFGTNMDVILPQRTRGQIGMEGEADQRPYQTLYLLHGMSDDHTAWQRRTSIERYVAPLGLAVVMPAVQFSWYTDLPSGSRYWAYIHEELPAICREFFPLSDRREDTFVAGLSMGGYGAMKIALADGEHFGAAASLSGALDMRRVIKEFHHPSYANAFGSAEAFEGSDHDLFSLAKRRKAQGGIIPKLYLWCGTEDFLLQDNERFAGYLRELGYDIDYRTSPGDHQWKCWDEQIQHVLDWLPLRGNVDK